MEQEEQDENWKNVYNNNIESSNGSKNGDQPEEEVAAGEEENEKIQNNINDYSNLQNNNKENIQQLNNQNVSPIKENKTKSENLNKTNLSNINITQKKDSNEDKNKDKENKRKRTIKKERYLMNVVQNFIIKNNFKKLVELSLQINYIDFDENDKNEKFLKTIRERLGIEKYLCLIIKSQRDLQKTYFENKRQKKRHISHILFQVFHLL